MTNIERFNDEVKKIEINLKEFEKSVNSAWEKHAEFLGKFPFRENPDAINKLTPKELYKPGGLDYFFLYLEHRTKPLGAIAAPSDLPWRNAQEDIEKFKDLLRISIDESISLAEKVDSSWESISYWGGDKHFAKKIIFCYFPEKTIPIFNTNHMEHFIEKLGLNEEKKKVSKHKFSKEYDDLTLGQQYEVLTEVLLRVKAKTVLKNANISIFTRALYQVYPPSVSILPPTKVVEPLSAVKMLFSPVNEMGVVALFSMYHLELGFPYLLKIQSGFPDATVIDSKGNLKEIEFELFSSSFYGHKHDPDKCDIVICWEDNLDEDDDLRSKVKIISIKEKLGSKED